MAGFGTTPLSTTSIGANQFPATAVAVPGEASGNFTALRGANETTDSNGNKLADASIAIADSAHVTFGAQADTVTVDPLGTNTAMSILKGLLETTHFIEYHIQQGHGFSATTTYIATGGASAFICLQLAVNNIAKKVLIYSIEVTNSNVMNDGRVYTSNTATADSNLSALTAYNSKPGSATATALTTIAGSAAGTTQTTGFTGAISANFNCGGTNDQQVLQNGARYFFANGDVASVEVAMKIVTSGNNGAITVKWIEYT